MALDMVANMEVGKVAVMVADKKNPIWPRGLVDWAQTCLTRTLPDLGVF